MPLEGLVSETFNNSQGNRGKEVNSVKDLENRKFSGKMLKVRESSREIFFAVFRFFS